MSRPDVDFYRRWSIGGGALEAEGCIRGSSMHWRSTEVNGAAGADGAVGEYKMPKAVKVVRTCQNWMELVWGYFCCM
jgi:hypothetical protein